MSRILIVEDEPDIQELLCAYLRDAGHEAEASENGSILDNDQEYLLTVAGNVKTVNQTQAAIRQVFPYLLVIIMFIALLGA